MEGNINHRREVGKLGEDTACEMLIGMGHAILERNWRNSHLEIDIISYDPSGLHFVEVKTRNRSIQAPPQENVDRQKQRRIVKAAQGFLRTKKGIPYGNIEIHFDVVAVTFENGTYRAEWFPQAFIPLYI